MRCGKKRPAAGFRLVAPTDPGRVFGVLTSYNASSSRGRFAAGTSGARPLCSFLPAVRAMSQKTWGGRFSAPTDRLVEQFTESISFDQRLYPQDIRASQAHAH